VLGPDYPSRGEAFLLARSRQQEEAGKKQPAQETVEVLLRLAPSSLAGHDRLACLHYRQGNMDRAVEILDGWQRLAPRDHWPLVRQAIIEQERGNAQRRSEVIDRALGLTRGSLRAAVAFLGARLALRSALVGNPPSRAAPEEARRAEPDLHAPRQLLEECLREAPDHVEALWCLAAVRSVQGDRDGLAAQAALMDRPTVSDPRFHFLGAVCNLAARQYRQVLELAARAVKDHDLEVESRFVMAWAHLNLGEVDAAQQALRKAATEQKSPSASCARALLGQLSLQRGAFDEAVQWWSGIDPAARARWQLDEPLRQSVLLSGLLAMQEKRFEQAAERFREAGRLGLRDKRLGGMITLALVKAGQRLLFQQAAPTSEVRGQKSEVRKTAPLTSDL
jgi:tetratricopeptide (TPR) repeat protein